MPSLDIFSLVPPCMYTYIEVEGLVYIYIYTLNIYVCIDTWYVHEVSLLLHTYDSNDDWSYISFLIHHSCNHVCQYRSNKGHYCLLPSIIHCGSKKYFTEEHILMIIQHMQWVFPSFVHIFEVMIFSGLSGFRFYPKNGPWCWKIRWDSHWLLFWGSFAGEDLAWTRAGWGTGADLGYGSSRTGGHRVGWS